MSSLNAVHEGPPASLGPPLCPGVGTAARTLVFTDETGRIVLPVVSKAAGGVRKELVAGYAARTAAGDAVGLSKAFSEHE